VISGSPPHLVTPFWSLPRAAGYLEHIFVGCGAWVGEERRRVEAVATRDDVPLTPAERTELARLRKQVAEQGKDIAFLKKASAYFAASQPK